MSNLQENVVAQLREDGVITESEIAIQEGDLVIAKNVLTNEKRIKGKTSEVIKESKQILKG